MTDRPTWRRTWPDKSHDFVCAINGKDVGRIYRHTDRDRWHWFRWNDTGAAGICDTREEAVKAIAGM